MPRYDEDKIAELLTQLPPAPQAWITAAAEIPRTQRELADIMRRLETDEEFRRAVQADIDRALGHFGYTPDPRNVRAIRARVDHAGE